MDNGNSLMFFINDYVYKKYLRLYNFGGISFNLYQLHAIYIMQINEYIYMLFILSLYASQCKKYLNVCK